jgi:hypothetical protein
MGIEVKNLQTGQSYELGSNGGVIGRTGGGATIEIDDRAVSKRHARIFFEAGQWFIEDMKSVNGTVVEGNKIAEAVALSVGLVFSLSKHKFEVLRIPGRAPPAPLPEPETRTSHRAANNAANLPSDLRKDPVPRRRGGSPPRVADVDIAPPEATRGELPPASDQDLPPPAAFVPPVAPRVEPEPPRLEIDEYQPLSIGDALMLGLAVSAKTAPSLVFRPFATVRAHIAESPVPGVKQLPLACVLGPSLIISLLLTTAAGTIAAGVMGTFSAVDVLLIPVKGLIGGGIGALVMAFVWHPVLAFLVERCGGRSDARARTAHAAASIASALVLAIPQSLAIVATGVVATLVSISPVFALVQVVPALLSVFALSLPLFVQWSWWKSYGVAKWVTTVWLVLTILSGAFGAVRVIQPVTAAMSQMSASRGPAPEPPPPAAVVNETTPTTPPAPTALPARSAPINDASATPTTTTAKPLATPPTPPPSPPVSATTATRSPVGPGLPPSPLLKVDPISATTARKRAEIENVLDQDPTLLLRSDRARRLYQELLEQTARAEAKVDDDVDTARPELKPLVEKLRRARVLEASRDVVDDLHRELFGPER